MAARNLYLYTCVGFLLFILLGMLFFLRGMDGQIYQVSNGISFQTKYHSLPIFTQHLKGLVFTLSFFAGTLLLLLGLASPKIYVKKKKVLLKPMLPVPNEAENKEELEAQAQENQKVPPPFLEQETEEFLNEDDAEPMEGNQDDVVYGIGRITDDAIWDFIHTYPDSAVKFLYRKNLVNKPLSTQEEDIYSKWERRGMLRRKVQGCILEIMGWKSLPDQYPHDLWMALRERIFEMRSRSS